MPYVFLAVLLSAFSLGFWGGYRTQSAKVNTLEAGVIAQKEQARLVLEHETAKIKQAEQRAIEINAELDKAHEQDIQTINSYHERLAGIKLRDPGGESCPDTVRKNNVTGNPKAAAETGRELSRELADFLRGEARRADEIAAYAKECGAYVASVTGKSNR
jgi:hypothetical protein